MTLPEVEADFRAWRWWQKRLAEAEGKGCWRRERGQEYRQGPQAKVGEVLR